MSGLLRSDKGKFQSEFWSIICAFVFEINSRWEQVPTSSRRSNIQSIIHKMSHEVTLSLTLSLLFIPSSPLRFLSLYQLFISLLIFFSILIHPFLLSGSLDQIVSLILAPQQSIDLMIKKVTIHHNNHKFNALKMTQHTQMMINYGGQRLSSTPSHEHMIKHKVRRSGLTVLGSLT